MMENLSSTARTLIMLYRLVKAQEIQGLDGISDNMLAPFVAADCKIAMDKERLVTTPALGPTLDIADAGTAKLPKSDTTKLLTTQSEDARKKLGDYEEKRIKLLEVLRAYITTDMTKTTNQLISMIASNPTAMFESAPVKNELAKLASKLTEFNTLINKLKTEERNVVDTVESVYKAYCRLSGERALPIDRLLEAHTAPHLK